MGMHSIGYLFREGLKSLWKNRTMSIASVAVLISCLLLTGVAGLLTINLSSFMQEVEGHNTITVYLEDNLPALTAVKVGEDIRAIENIGECTFVPKDNALNSLMTRLEGDSTLFDGLQGSDNPLPDAYTISMVSLSQYQETIDAVQAVEGVDSITDYSNVANRLSSLDQLVRYASIGIVAVLAVVSLFIISNTVKVTMFSRRTEITIMKSVGATNGFVRFPFIVEGMVIGVISGLISAAIIHLGYGKAVEVVYAIVPFLTVVDITPYILYLYIAYILIGMIFGMAGGVISISRYLKKEGENAVV